MNTTPTEDLASVHSHAMPSALAGCRSFSDVVAEITEAKTGKWDTTLNASEIALDDQLTLPDGIRLTDNAVKSIARLTGVPSTVSTWCSEQGYRSHLSMFIGDSLKQIADEDNRTRRPPTRYFTRFGPGGGGSTVCRAIFTGQYGVLDNSDALTVVGRAFEMAELKDIVARRVSHDGDSLYVSLLVPDYAVTLADSEYGVGIELSNSEVDGPFTVSGFIYRAMCRNGMLLGVREGAEFSRRHIGRIDLDEITVGVQLAVRDALDRGRKSIDAHASAWQVRISNPKKLIAYMGKSGRLSREQTTAWLSGYDSTIKEPHSPELTLGAVLNGLTAAARNMTPWERKAMEWEAGRLLAPGIGMALTDVESRWADLERRASEVKDDELEKLEAPA